MKIDVKKILYFSLVATFGCLSAQGMAMPQEETLGFCGDCKSALL